MPTLARPKPKSNSKPKAYASRAKSQAQAELKSFYQLALTLTPASTLRLRLRTPPDPAPTTIPNLKSKSKNFTAEIWAYQPTTPSSYLPTVLIQKSKTKHETSISCHRLPDQQLSYVRPIWMFQDSIQHNQYNIITTTSRLFYQHYGSAPLNTRIVSQISLANYQIQN